MKKLGKPEASLVIGHSLGLFNAIVAAGAMDFEPALQLVGARGRIMQEEPDIGLAIAKGPTEDEIDDIRSSLHAPDSTEQSFWILAYNKIGQHLIAAKYPELFSSPALKDLKGKINAIKIPSPKPFHSMAMSLAAEKMRIKIEQANIRDPRIPIVSTNSSERVPHEVYKELLQTKEDIIKELYNQIITPLRWIRAVEFADRQGILWYFESGPGDILCDFIRSILNKGYEPCYPVDCLLDGTVPISDILQPLPL